MAKQLKIETRRVIHSFGLSLITTLMIVGLLTPVIGPAVDHHYVDRSPAHAHVFNGDEAHAHDHSLGSHDHSDENFGGSGDGSSILTTSASSGYVPLTLDGATQELTMPTFEGNNIEVLALTQIVPDDDVIAPLDRPPRSV